MPVAGVDHVYVVGPLPPPVHGASVITRSVVDLLGSVGTSTVECNISPSVRARGWRWHVSRSRAYARALGRIFTARSRSRVYIALSGGNGLLYDLLVVACVRLRGHRLILHHHSFDYVDRDRLVLSLLLLLAPKDHVHLVLCQDMAHKLRARYRMELRCVHVSNFCFFPSGSVAAHERRELRRVGFLSNIALDKGIDKFLDLAGRFVGRDDMEFHVAGPFADEAARSYVERRLAELPNVTCHGPVYGEQKQKFYDSIDLFVFLSRYSHEAEPLVVYEAMSAGLPVAVTARGCLCEMVDPEGAIVVDRNADDVEAVVRRVTEWKDAPHSYREACAASTRHVGRLEAARGRQKDALLAAFSPARAKPTGQARPIRRAF